MRDEIREDEVAPSLVDGVYESLLQAVRSRDLKPGTKLSENELGQLLGVSRTIVRAALNRLHSEALVDFHRNRGAYVASPSPQQAREVLDLRSILEVEMVRRLAADISPDALRQLEAHQAAQRKANEAGPNVAATRLAVEFHLLLAKILGDEVFRQTLENLILRGSLILSLYGRPHTKDCGLHEHDVIIEALKRGDAAEAGRLMERHLADVVRRTELAGEGDDRRNVRDILRRYAADA